MSKSYDIKQWAGEELYDLYRYKHLSAFNCETGSWEQLSDEDRAVWEHIAETVSQEGGR